MAIPELSLPLRAVLRIETVASVALAATKLTDRPVILAEDRRPEE